MDESTYVGLDAHAATTAVAVAEAGLAAPRFIGTVGAKFAELTRALSKLGADTQAGFDIKKAIEVIENFDIGRKLAGFCGFSCGISTLSRSPGARSLWQQSAPRALILSADRCGLSGSSLARLPP